ncbi:hypothetical protein P3X46_006975 [Hevea brasiliensis]|uniref:Cytochrome P450 n=1 Tax=Hevea brasiliensis TaxID=3981 RepID=A0ABQ9MTZ4_HEVBR|nr:cytochrome P450 72A15 isoform X1 [Hevea brasiliensis]KAJ9183060.1 hypothetical protein P3X46_006975 [Hevea brasiliensis]
MEASSSSSVAVSIILVIIVTLGWRILNWVWFKPKTLERFLRQQGLAGNPYRFFHGDLKESVAMIKQARSQPFDFSQHLALRVAPFLLQILNNYGKNSFIWIGPIPRVNITNPVHIKEVFTKINEFQKVKMLPQFNVLIPGLVSYEGDKWAKHRKIINPAFHQEKLKLMLPVFYQCCNEMIEKWEKLITTKESCELDVWSYLQNLSRDCISRAAFGSNHEQGKRIFQLLKELSILIMQAAQTVYIPGWRFLPTKANQRIKEIDREIQASLKSMISKRENAMKAREATNDDLLGLLIESNLRETKERLSIQDVIDECKLFYFAGQETTSVLLVWTMILLSKYPHWQAQAREEVLQVFGGKKPEFDGLNHLKVMLQVTMILYEVLRLYPVGIAFTRTVSEETRLGDLILPAGVQIALPIILVQQDPELWGKDAAEFKPERFCEGVSKATKNQVSFFPFGWGHRICIGQNFALLEAKMAVAIILQHFSFQLSPSYSHAPHSIITIQPEHGAQLILRKL